jgi:NADPH2:quinone reductase
MRAAVVTAVGEVPGVRDVAEPERPTGHALVRVLAAPLNPIDLSIAAGRFYRGTPETPFVPGKEAVAEVIEADGLDRGQLVWIETPGGLGGPGAIAERVAVAERDVIALPDVDIDPAQAASLGIAGLAAWFPLSRKAALQEGERVLILGASGAVGAIGIQAARLLGAGRVVAAARSREGLARATELGADATVLLDGSGDLAEAFVEAAGGPIDVTLDPLWAEPAAAAARAAAPGGRILHVGRSAGDECTFRSADIRGKGVSVLGYTHFSMSPEVRAEAYRELVEHTAAGRIVVDAETVGLEQVADAWRRQAAYPHRKLVVVP